MNADNPKAPSNTALPYSFRFQHGGYQVVKTNNPGHPIWFNWNKDKVVEAVKKLNQGQPASEVFK